MRVMVPVSRLEVLESFCQAGADELYFGFTDEKWTRKFGVFEEINRMSSFGSVANFKLTEIPEVIRGIQAYGRKAYLTLNSSIYAAGQLAYLDRLLSEGCFAAADGIIACDPSLIRIIQKHKIPVILSTMAGAYNSMVIDFYRELGIRRIIIPRDVQLSDIESIAKKFPDLEFEVFFMRNGCRYSDANCMSFHGRTYSSMCSCMDRAKAEIVFQSSLSVEEQREAYSNHKLFTKAFHKEACGLCALERLYKAGIKSLKIVGRADRAEDLVRDICIVKQAVERIEHGEQDAGQEEYENCLYGLNCYYPDGSLR